MDWIGRLTDLLEGTIKQFKVGPVAEAAQARLGECRKQRDALAQPEGRRRAKVADLRKARRQLAAVDKTIEDTEEELTAAQERVALLTDQQLANQASKVELEADIAALSAAITTIDLQATVGEAAGSAPQGWLKWDDAPPEIAEKVKGVMRELLEFRNKAASEKAAQAEAAKVKPDENVDSAGGGNARTGAGTAVPPGGGAMEVDPQEVPLPESDDGLDEALGKAGVEAPQDATPETKRTLLLQTNAVAAAKRRRLERLDRGGGARGGA